MLLLAYWLIKQTRQSIMCKVFKFISYSSSDRMKTFVTFKAYIKKYQNKSK